MVNPTAEQPTRQMLALAIRHETDDLAAVIYAAGDAALAAVLDLCVLIAAYVAIEASGMSWPSEAALTQIARQAAESATGLDVSGEEILALLSRVAFGSETLDDSSAVGGAGPAPLYATASLLVAYCPRDMHWSEYYDQIWNAYNAAEMIDKPVLPALMFRVRKEGPGSYLWACSVIRTKTRSTSLSSGSTRCVRRSRGLTRCRLPTWRPRS
jgi:hypothetical protein